jgi:stress response protein YsnF
VSIQSYDPQALQGKTVYAADGEKLGKVDEVHVDRHGQAQYIETKKGLFSGRRHVIPVGGLSWQDEDELLVPYTREQLEQAPAYDPDAPLDYEREREIGNYYGTGVRAWEEGDELAGEDLSRGPTPETRHPETVTDDVRDTTEGPTPDTRVADRAAEGAPAASGQPEADRRTRAERGGNQDVGRRAEPAAERGARGDETMTRSEEEVRVGTTQREAGRVRLRKWVDTEPVSETVTTRREEARIQREPITEANRDQALSGPEITESEHEVTLTREEAVAEKRTVPKERVRLEKDVVEEEQRVSEEVRKERIEVDGDVEVRDEGPRGR